MILGRERPLWARGRSWAKPPAVALRYSAGHVSLPLFQDARRTPAIRLHPAMARHLLCPRARRGVKGAINGKPREDDRSERRGRRARARDCPAITVLRSLAGRCLA